MGQVQDVEARTEPTPVWREARAQLAGLPGGRGPNIAHEAVGRHVAEGHGERVALRCIDLDGSVAEDTYRDLHLLTNRFASCERLLSTRPAAHPPG